MSLKVLVAVKRVVDYNIRVHAKPDASGVELANLKMSTNPFDEIALEAAIQLKEQGHAAEVLAVTIGTEAAKDVLRNALALGADRAILVKTEKNLTPIDVAKVLQKIAQQEVVKLALLGKQAIDDDANQTAQMLAGLLTWPQATFASKIEMAQDEVLVSREVDGGTITLGLRLPAVISADLRLNAPRFATLPNIMKAKQKPLQEITLDALGVVPNNDMTVLHTSDPPPRASKVQVLADVTALVDVLKNTVKVI